MKKYLWNILIMMFCLGAFAQKGNLIIKLNDSSFKQPMMGATVELLQTNFRDVSNNDGEVVFNKIPFGNYTLRVSSLGFKTYDKKTVLNKINQTIEVNLEILSEELQGVVIKASRGSRTVRDIPTRIEFVSEEELEEKAIMNSANISMVLRESNGIQIQQTSLSSGNTSIKIQGLDGRYTQLLKDGFPLYGGFSGGLSLNQIPPLDLAQFEIIKGSSSTLYGGGAIAGLVNLVSKTPKDKPILDVLLTQTHVGGTTANVFYSEKHNKFGYTLYGIGSRQNIYNPDNDSFSNLPNIKTVSFNPKFYYYPNKDTEFWIGLNATLDKREGGVVSAIKNKTALVGDYIEKNNSKRGNAQAFFKYNVTQDKNITLKQSFSYFDRVQNTPNLIFSGNQTDVFTEVSYLIDTEKKDWVLGANYYQSSFNEDLVSGNRNYNNQTIGAFISSTYNITHKIILESGLRTDYSFDYGVFVLPRISLLWNKTKKFTTRLGGGLGYKLPDMFSEEASEINFKGVKGIDKNKVDAEVSYGVNWDVNYKTRLSEELRLSFNQLFYVTGIDKALILQTKNNEIHEFINANDFVLSRGAETNVKFSLYDFKWFLSYAYNHTTLNYLANKPQKSLTPKHTAGSVFMYENENWRIGLESYYTGNQRLNNGRKTTDYVLFGFLLQKHFRWGSPFINFENFTDVRQGRFTPEVTGTNSNPKFNQIYAPTDGFVFSVGIKFSVLGKEEHHKH